MFPEMLHKLRTDHSLSMDEMVERYNRQFSTKLNKSTLSRYENGLQEPMYSTVVNLARFFGVSVDEMTGNTGDSPTPSGDNTVSFPSLELNQQETAHLKKYRGLDSHGKRVVDLVTDEEASRISRTGRISDDATQNGQHYTGNIITLRDFEVPVSAGVGIDFWSDPGKDIDVIANYYTSQADYVLHVEGHSMEPRFRDGDTILVQEADDVDIGEVGIWNIGNKAYIKKKGDGVLISVNPRYKNIEPEEWEDIQNCQGRVIGVLDPAWIIDHGN